MRSHDEHWLCGPQRVCKAENYSLCPVSFHHQSQGKPGQGILCFILQFSCLYPFDLSYCLAQLSGLCLLCPVFQLFSCLSRLPCLGLKRLSNLFNGQHPHHQRGFASLLPTIEPSGRYMEYPEVIHTEAMNQSCVLALQKKECSREQDLKYLNLFQEENTMVSKIKSYVEFLCKINCTDGSFAGYGERRCKILSLNLLSSPDSSGKQRTKPPALPVIVGISKFIVSCKSDEAYKGFKKKWGRWPQWWPTLGCSAAARPPWVFVTGDALSIFFQEEPLEQEIATHSSIVAWRIPQTEEPGGYCPWGHRESDMTEHTQINTYIHSFIYYFPFWFVTIHSGY